MVVVLTNLFGDGPTGIWMELCCMGGACWVGGAVWMWRGCWVGGACCICGWCAYWLLEKKNDDTWSDHTSVWITTNYQQIWHLFYQKHLKENFHRFKDCLIMSRWRGSRCHMTLPEFSCSSFFKEKLVLLFLNSQNPHIQKERQRTWCQRDSVKKCCFFF